MPQVVVRHGVSWAQYERTLARKGERRWPILTYLDGELEIMSPSERHDDVSSRIGHLLMAYAGEHGIELRSLRSWTVKNRTANAAAEADECFVVGPFRRARRPDVSIEVVRWRGGRKKLDVYHRLRVPEVWLWIRGKIELYRWSRRHYLAVAESRYFPGIDLVQLCDYLDRKDVTTSGLLAEYRAAIGR